MYKIVLVRGTINLINTSKKDSITLRMAKYKRAKRILIHTIRYRIMKTYKSAQS